MSTQSLQDLIGTIKTKHKNAYDKAASGEAPDSAWEGPEMPLTWEYRAVVDKAEYKASAAGNMQFVITYEIQEPVEFKGRKVQNYQNPNPTNEKGSEYLARFFGTFSANLDSWGEDMDGFIKQIEGKTAVIALRRWGTESDRYGVRWENSDRGQSLRTNVPLETAKKASATNLRPDIQIPKEEPFPDTTQAPAATPSEPAKPTLPAGPNLPPGLRG